MKKIVLLAGVFALAACGGEAEAPEAAAEEAVATYAGGAGTYTRTNAEGETQSTVITADGTYTTSVGGEEVTSGTVVTEGAKTCFDWEANEGEPQCWSNQPMRADGSFETTDPEGTTHVIQMTPAAAE